MATVSASGTGKKMISSNPKSFGFINPSPPPTNTPSSKAQHIFISTAATSSPQQCWVCGAMERSTAIKISLTFNYWSFSAPRCIALTHAHLRSSLNLSQDALFAQFLIVDISTPPASSTFHSTISTFDSGNTSRHSLHQQHPPLVVS